jgi:hypothetical protein
MEDNFNDSLMIVVVHRAASYEYVVLLPFTDVLNDGMVN